jgi:hypothetical protein
LLAEHWQPEGLASPSTCNYRISGRPLSERPQLSARVSSVPRRVTVSALATGDLSCRSEFIRGVIARALHDTLELGTRQAYEKCPDENRSIDPGEWAGADEAVRPPTEPTRPATVRKKKARR